MPRIKAIMQEGNSTVMQFCGIIVHDGTSDLVRNTGGMQDEDHSHQRNGEAWSYI